MGITKRRAVGALVVVALLVGVWFLAQSQVDSGGGEQASTLFIQREVERSTLQDVVTLQGELLRDELQTVNSPVDGRVSAVFVEDGDTVAPGDTLFALDGRSAVAVNGDFAFFRQLDVGSDGPDVLQLETILRDAGYDVGPVDRLFTESTRAGLARWQVDNGYGGATPEPGETVTVTLQQNPAGYTIGAQNTAAVTIGPSVPPGPRGLVRPGGVGPLAQPTTLPRVEVTVDVAQVVEGQQATFTFTVDQPFTSPTIVEIGTDGDATADDDYEEIPDSVRFEPGVTSVALVVTTIEDDVLETEDEDLTVTITDQFVQDPVYNVGGLSEATVTILADGADERPVIRIEAAEPRVVEGGGGGGGGGDISMTLTSTLELNEDLDVYYRLSGSAVLGDDYVDPDRETDGMVGIVTLTAGSTTVDLSIDVRDDDRVEYDEDVVVSLVPNPEDAPDDPSYVVAFAGSSAFTIVESDDVPELSLRGGGSIGEGGAASVIVVADQAPVVDTSVNYQVSGSARVGEDFEALTGTVLLRAGQTQAAVPIRSLDDDVVFLPSDMIVADWPARVGTVAVDDGEFVLQGGPLLSLTEPVFTIKLYANATQFSDLVVGQEVTVELAAGDQTAEGVIAELDEAATVDDTGTERYEGVVQITTELAAVDGAVVTIDVVIDQAADVLVVPISAVSQDATGNKEVRLLSRDGTISRVAVETGLEDGSLIEISSGLSGGEIVIVEIDPA